MIFHKGSEIEVSSDGLRVVIDGAEVSSHKNNGYMEVQWGGRVNMEREYVHRLVGMVYVSNPEGKECIDHIDGNKENNDYRNLRWVTRGENNSYGWDNHGELTREKAWVGVDKEGRLRNMRLARMTPVVNLWSGVVFESLEAASRSVGGTRPGLYQALKKSGFYKGVPFRYFTGEKGRETLEKKQIEELRDKLFEKIVKTSGVEKTKDIMAAVDNFILCMK